MYFSCGQARLSGILYKPTVSILSLLDENNVLGHRLKTGRPELKLQPRPTSPSTSISPVDQAEDQEAEIQEETRGAGMPWMRARTQILK